MRVVGTAGHVDHGKSTLVTALTGINPDRLKEEQERQMTIDLGFAWMTLPSGQTVSFVDVPGHEAFIKNMLAGVGGIDAALFVVAADEGIMPQTREHLAILDLLQVKGGVVALTKSDIITEPGWLELVQSEVRHELSGTVLANAPIVRVSAKTGLGLPTLIESLDKVLTNVQEKKDRGRPRLPIDRVFSMSGFGTVVTGTLTDGALSEGDEVEIAPKGLRARLRGLQVHKIKQRRALPGGRAAVNLTGIATDQVARGDTLVLPGTYRATEMIDAHLTWLESSPKPLAHNQNLDLFAFASEVPVRVRLLEVDKLEQGASGWAQLVLESPLVLEKGDRFVLRYPSPSLTVGGGVVVEPHPSARHKRGRRAVVEQLERSEHGEPADLIIQLVDTHGPLEPQELSGKLRMDEPVLESITKELVASGQLVELSQNRSRFLVTRGQWSAWSDRFLNILDDYHKHFPLRSGMPREEFKSRLHLPTRAFEAAIQTAASQGVVRLNEKFVSLPNHHIHFEGDLSARVGDLLTKFERAPASPPSYTEASEAIGQEALNALIEQGRLVRISETVLLTPTTEREMTRWVQEAISKQGQVTASELRDRFATSRKYAVALLEYLDQKRITRRVGDARVLR